VNFHLGAYRGPRWLRPLTAGVRGNITSVALSPANCLFRPTIADAVALLTQFIQIGAAVKTGMKIDL
jgi:hypothetical protein